MKPHLSNSAATSEAFARMYDERAAARVAKRRAFQVAAAFNSLPVQRLTPKPIESLLGAYSWDTFRAETMRARLNDSEWPELSYSPRTDSCWTADLGPDELPELGGDLRGAVVAREYTRQGLLHLRTVIKE
jgi:hypothetical protein